MASVELFHREFGQPGHPPLVILPGLLGNSRNWQIAARSLAEYFRVFALDLRNHGESPHAGEHSVSLMVEDVRAWLDRHVEGAAHLMGHSMGGKVAMKLACDVPEAVESLVVVDIAPKHYPGLRSIEIEAMQALSLGSLSSRREAERALEESVPDLSTRQFLLTNLSRLDSGDFFWRPNLSALAGTIADMRRNPLEADERFAGRTLFVVGGGSDYVLGEDRSAILHHFPTSRVEVIADGQHNVHIDAREAFVEAVRAFVMDGD